MFCSVDASPTIPLCSLRPPSIHLVRGLLVNWEYALMSGFDLLLSLGREDMGTCVEQVRKEVKAKGGEKTKNERLKTFRRCWEKHGFSFFVNELINSGGVRAQRWGCFWRLLQVMHISCSSPTRLAVLFHVLCQVKFLCQVPQLQNCAAGTVHFKSFSGRLSFNLPGSTCEPAQTFLFYTSGNEEILFLNSLIWFFLFMYLSQTIQKPKIAATCKSLGKVNTFVTLHATLFYGISYN